MLPTVSARERVKLKGDHHFESILKPDNVTLKKNNAVLKYKGYSNVKRRTKTMSRNCKKEVEE